MNRYNYLSDLIKGIFNKKEVSFKFENDVYYLQVENGLLSRCNFNSAEFPNRFRKLFQLAFAIDNEKVVCEIKKNNKTAKTEAKFLSKQDITDNCIRYFLSKKIDFRFLTDFCTESEMERYLLDAICYYLIPAAFVPVNTKQTQFDEIHNYVQEAFIQIKLMLLDIRFRKLYCTDKDLPEIKDYDYSEHDFNYAVRLQLSSDFVSDLVPWNDFAVSFPRKKYALIKESEFDQLVKGFSPYPFIAKQHGFHFEDTIFDVKGTDSISFPLSSVIVNENEIRIYAAYYLTHLDPESIKREYPDASNHEELEAAIIKKAKRDIIKCFEKNKRSYYERILLYIEDILETLSKPDIYECIVSNRITKEKCKKALLAFKIPFDLIISELEKTYEKDKCCEEGIRFLQETLSDFASHIKAFGNQLAAKVFELFPSDSQNRHARKVEVFLIMINDDEKRDCRHPLDILFKEVLSGYLQQLRHPDPPISYDFDNLKESVQFSGFFEKNNSGD